MPAIEAPALIQAALEARKHAYVPYSQMAVGAALLTETGVVFSGCNIENASYSPTLCAERVALAKAISEGHRAFLAIAIAGGPQTIPDQLPRLFYPCGVCRQCLSEHCQGDFQIIVAKSVSDYTIHRLCELLPNSFSL